jgi:short-subunit dehydrogenase
MKWDQQIIVVTGAYGGLGQQLCHELSKLGAKLVLTGRNQEKLYELQSELESIFNSKPYVLSGDVVSDSFQEDLSQLLQNLNSQGHILINNAAISDVRFLSKQSNDSIKQMLDVNLLAPILLSKALQPWLAKAQLGKIINIGSTFGAIGYPGFSGYCASKFGLRGFSQALSRELSDTSISVQYLAPRAISTSINSNQVDQLNVELKNKVDTPVQLVPQIIAAIEQDKQETFFGWPEKLFTKLNGLFPSVVSGSIKKEHKTIKNYLNQ